MLLHAALAIGALGAPPQSPADLGAAVRAYLAAPDARGPELTALVAAASGREAELEQLLRTKRFVVDRAPVARRGTIEGGRFVDAHDEHDPNPALLCGPAAPAEPLPLIVYVPDTTTSAPFANELQRDGADRGLFVLLVPDEKRDNRYESTPAELDRHTAPLRQLLEQYAIDPDRVYFVGSGRGGHAAWDVGLMRADRFAGIFPCNGGLIHEGGFATTGGVFVENGRNLTIFTVYNTTFDHGIESCRVATRLLTAWGARFEAAEEPRMRVMGLAEAMQKLAPVTRNAHPRSIVKRFNRLADGAHCWLEALDRRPREWDPRARIEVRAADWPKDPAAQRQVVWERVQKQCARLEGAIAGNGVRVRTQGVGRLRIWWDPELVDFDARVAIEIDGVPQRSVQPKRRLDVMLRRFWATGDSARLYWDFVDVPVPR